MIRKAEGTLIRRTAVAATTNRTSQMLVARKSTIGLPNRITTRASPAARSSRTGTIVKTSLPARVSLDQERAITVTRRALGLERRAALNEGAERHRETPDGPA